MFLAKFLGLVTAPLGLETTLRLPLGLGTVPLGLGKAILGLGRSASRFVMN